MIEPPASGIVIRRVAVIGAGSAGRNFAATCLRAGFDVTLEDVMPSNLRRAESDFADLSVHGQGYGLLELVSTVEDAVHSADIAIDFVPDELESKLEILSLLDRMAPPRTILCMPSDALSITDLASCTYRPERCLAIRGGLSHPSALQLLFAKGVSPGILDAASDFFRRLGHTVSPTPDPDVPMLEKNLAGYRN